jgi:hypothetical protein
VAVEEVKVLKESRTSRVGQEPSSTIGAEVAVEVKVLKESRTASRGGQDPSSTIGAKVVVDESVQAAEKMQVGERM